MSKKQYNVAVVGATGNVGRTMLDVLSERNFPVGKVHAIASKNSAGKEVAFGDDKRLIVQDLEKFDFAGAVTAVPAFGVVADCRCTQNVSPTGARNSSTFVWPAPTVRVAERATLLDNVMPEYQFSERHSTRVHANPERVLRAVRQSTFRDMKSLMTLLKLRGAVLRHDDSSTSWRPSSRSQGNGTAASAPVVPGIPEARQTSPTPPPTGS